jgi:hypothetical protein
VLFVEATAKDVERILRQPGEQLGIPIASMISRTARAMRSWSIATVVCMATYGR